MSAANSATSAEASDLESSAENSFNASMAQAESFDATLNDD